jgi:GDP-L-fucose synthase
VPPEHIAICRSRRYDLLERLAVRRLYQDIFGGEGPTLILHAAGFVGGLGANRKWPADFFFRNLGMTMTLIEEARTRGFIERGMKFVQVGTMCSYPAGAAIPYREESLWLGKPDPEVAPYGLAKLAALEMLEAYGSQHGLRSAYVIPTGFFGPGDNINPENSHVAGALVRKYVDAQATGAPEVVNWGTGSPRRDFIYIEDAAAGVLRAAEVMDTPTPINLTGGEEVSIRELAEMVARLAGYEGRTLWDASKGDGQPRRSLDGTRAKTLLHWSPRVTLEEGLRRTVEWYRSVRE